MGKIYPNITAFYVGCSLLCSQSLAWNANGHRIIAQIAVNHLTPHAKVRFNTYNRLLNQKKYQYNLVGSATWLDKVRDRRLHKKMHYIDIPFSQEKLPLPRVAPMNAVVALYQAEEKLLNSKANDYERAVALRIILHVVGDLHQPLHAATYVTRQNPQGDQGGNLTALPTNPIATTLHAYWDRGAGVLSTSMNQREIKRYATVLESRWPCQEEIETGNYRKWAEESHAIAVKDAYTFPVDNPLNASYQRDSAQRIEARLVLAGCRLAAVLNHIDHTLAAKPIKKMT